MIPRKDKLTQVDIFPLASYYFFMNRKGFSINTGLVLMLILLVVSRFRYGVSDPAEFFLDILITLPGIVLGLTFHEFGHAFVAYRLGDNTPKNQGRVTLNPLAHIDLFGFVCLIFAGFGWGRPVEINPYAYKHPRRDRLLVSFAGVTMNAIIILVLSLVSRAAIPALMYSSYEGSYFIIQILLNAISINIMLMIFNLLPVPPLDGFNVVTEIFDLRKYGWYDKLYSFGGIILMVLILFRLTGYILTPAVQGIFSFLMNNIIFA